MVKVKNDWVEVSLDDPSTVYLRTALTYTEPATVRRVKGKEYRIREKTFRLYSLKGNSIFIPRGLFCLLEDSIKAFSDKIVYEEKKTRISDVSDQFLYDLEKYRDALDGISLRDEQLMAARKTLFFKRCINQIATGGGKTEIMCVLAKILADLNGGVYPTILVIEPTIKLMSDIMKRFKKYDIPIEEYSKNRMIIKNRVNISHPISLGNDIEKNGRCLEDVQVLFGDETHHLAADSFRKPIYNMPNLEYSVGFSASAIQQDHVLSTNLGDYSYDEALVIGATGKVVMNITPSQLISKGRLSTPVLFMVENDTDEVLSEDDVNNWSKIQEVKVESKARVDLLTDVAKFFFEKERKSLILVKTVRHAALILKSLHEKGIGDFTRASFGGNKFVRYNGYELEDVKHEEVFDRFESGTYRILVGTQHLIEGVDVPDLDVVILACAGKNEKVLVQSVGRVLRKSKSGKYAYIVDFNDYKDVVLSKHSRFRTDRYIDLIGVERNKIFFVRDNQIDSIFKDLEGS